MNTRWVCGIDISKDKFDVCLKKQGATNDLVIKGSRGFKNEESGFKEFLLWVEKRTFKETVSFVMEATGVYYENLAYYLYELGCSVFVELANKVKNYIRSLNVKTKTDKKDASVLADMGFERRMKAWSPMSESYKELRDIPRLIAAYQKDLNRAESQYHAMCYAHKKSRIVSDAHSKHIKHCKELIVKLKKERIMLAKKDTVLWNKIAKITTIKGVRFDTAISILCETNGFAMFNNVRQVVSLCRIGRFS